MRAYAARYRTLVERVREAEARKIGAGTALTEAVARYYFKLMAYKDEYEVARLHADPAFARKIEGMFEGGYQLKFHLAPPVFKQARSAHGRSAKSQFGAWMMPAFRILAKLKAPARHRSGRLRLHRGAQDRAAAHRANTRRP